MGTIKAEGRKENGEGGKEGKQEKPGKRREEKGGKEGKGEK